MKPRTQPFANETWKMYYAAGTELVAMRTLTVTGNTLYYLSSDHLGSTSLTMDSGGNRIGEIRYKPYGEIRYTAGISPTNIGYTGQRLDATGLMFYQARYYSPVAGRFISPDSVAPGNPQSFNRYAYTNNNPLRYIDSSGHCIDGLTTVVCIVVFAFIIAAIPSDTPAPPASQQYRTQIATSAHNWGVPEIALAAAVNIQSVGETLPLAKRLDSTFKITGYEYSFGVGGIKPSLATELTGRTYSIDELEDPATSIDLLAAKMAKDMRYYGSICKAECRFPDANIALAIGQNGFGADNINTMRAKGIETVLAADDERAANSAAEAMGLHPSSLGQWIGQQRTLDLWTHWWHGTGNMRYQIRLFNYWLSILSQRGYQLPPGYDFDYMNCLGQGKSACSPPQ